MSRAIDDGHSVTIRRRGGGGDIRHFRDLFPEFDFRNCEEIRLESFPRLLAVSKQPSVVSP
jgi:hypothetical protein